MALARTGGADFSRVITIGRQQVHVPPEDLEAFFRLRGRDDIAARLSAAPGDGYCEQLLKVAFGAVEVQSLDASDYEQATIIHDMNAPLTLDERFPVVLDFGTLEHVLNVATAFDNVAALCAQGGAILHVLPGNNLAGHGFYQFSPEFFFQVYSEQRGFAGTRVFAAPEGAPQTWYEIAAPHTLKARVNLTSRQEVYLLVLTRKIATPTPLVERPVQQSDYVELWKERATGSGNRRRSLLERSARELLSGIRHERKVAKRDVRRSRADVTPRRVLALTEKF